MFMQLGFFIFTQFCYSFLRASYSSTFHYKTKILRFHLTSIFPSMFTLLQEFEAFSACMRCMWKAVSSIRNVRIDRENACVIGPLPHSLRIMWGSHHG